MGTSGTVALDPLTFLVLILVIVVIVVLLVRR